MKTFILMLLACVRLQAASYSSGGAAAYAYGGNIGPMTNVTMACWFKGDHTPNTITFDFSMSMANGSANGLHFIWDHITPAWMGTCAFINGPVEVAVFNPAMNTNWHHLAITFTNAANGTLTAYVDGTQTGATVSAIAPEVGGAMHWAIQIIYPYNTFGAPGAMADAVRYDAILTPAQIKMLALGVSPRTVAGHLLSPSRNVDYLPLTEQYFRNPLGKSYTTSGLVFTSPNPRLNGPRL